VAGDLVADRYELEELVGAGGMSSVYKARDTLLERNVALKILHPQYGDDDEYVERFRREARAVARLSHPNIVTVIDRGEDANGHQFIVFEYVDGENLKELIDRTGPLPVRRAIELTLQIAHALAFAHEHGLVHRDVKPQNVLLNDAGEAKVTDFGIARSLDVDRGMTQTGTVLGTSNYIAPEQASGRPVEARTDVYSLGVVVYELLTGEVPFPGENFVAVAMKHINEPPPSLLEKRPDAPIRLVAAVDRALAKDPDDRFPTMADFAAELEACLVELGSPDGDRTAIVRAPVLRASAPRRMRGRPSRWPLVLSVLAVLAAAAVLAGVLALGGSTSKHHTGNGTTSGGVAIALSGVSGYDRAARLATDGNPSTAWDTEHYSSREFGGLKHGVGLVLGAKGGTAAKTLSVTTDTPGFEAKILAGDAAGGPFNDDSATKTVAGHTTFQLRGANARYYVIWITLLPPDADHVDVNEATARS
jgi:serine/threonine-protein kinase